MCGICIWINRNGELEPNTLNEAISLQQHRGPDQTKAIFYNDSFEEVFSGENLDKKDTKNIKLGVAHTRLSIIDLSSKSNQPMLSSDNKKLIAFNGEIYNYVELREELKNKNNVKFITEGDTEVLLNWMSINGTKNLSKLNGMWAFAFINKITNEITFSRDRYGKKPLLYYSDEDNFIASSDYRSIFHILNKKRKINDKYLLAFLMNKKWVNFSSGETFYKDVFSILPGGELKFDLKNFTYESSRVNNINQYIGKNCSKDMVIEDLRSSIKLRLRSDVPIGILLSGGVDSSLIASFVAENNYTNIQFYTLADHETDLISAREVASCLNIPLKEVSLDLTDEKFEQITSTLLKHFEIPINFGLVALPLYIVCEQMKKDGVKVLLDGTGGDEVFGGYPEYLRVLENNLLKEKKVISAFRYFNQANLHENRRGIHLFKRYILFLLRVINSNIFVSDSTREYRGKLFNKFSKSNYAFEIKQVLKECDSSKLFSPKEMQIDTLDQMLVNYLVITDRASMAHSIESRSPFLDYRLAKYMNLRQSDTFNKGFNKYLLRNIMPKVISDKIRWRRSKAGFSLTKKINDYTQSSEMIEGEILNSKILNHFFDLKPLLDEIDKMKTNKHVSTLRDNMFSVSQLEKHFEFDLH
jgi:asparagine synthase (glutamine-hydrolysing)